MIGFWLAFVFVPCVLFVLCFGVCDAFRALCLLFDLCVWCSDFVLGVVFECLVG